MIDKNKLEKLRIDPIKYSEKYYRAQEFRPVVTFDNSGKAVEIIERYEQLGKLIRKLKPDSKASDGQLWSRVRHLLRRHEFEKAGGEIVKGDKFYTIGKSMAGLRFRYLSDFEEDKGGK